MRRMRLLPAPQIESVKPANSRSIKQLIAIERDSLPDQ